MMISRINSTYDNINTKKNPDNEKSNLQTKLMAEQRRLKAVDSDINMEASEKIKEKLKIQQQIDELNRKMKLEELEKESAESASVKEVKAENEAEFGTKGDLTKAGELGKNKNDVEEKNKVLSGDDKKIKDNEKTKDAKKSKEEKNVEQAEETKEEKEKKDKQSIPPQELHKMLSADFELLKERVLNQVADKKEGTEDVLRAEIKADSIQGTDVESKKEKLAEMRQRKTVQVETIEQDRKETLAQPKDGMKVVIK